ncbi:alpha-glucuronidase [Luteimicrobium sp. DT211]|uniref:alpha-glucuronidase n=1 Tax=Luteimicrobium sp. DT211 TaxID=3393412 RepID=UPI003CEC8FF7
MSENSVSTPGWHAAWLPDDAFAPLGRRVVAVVAGPGAGPLVATVVREVRTAAARFGGRILLADAASAGGEARPDLVLALEPGAGLPAEGYAVVRTDGTTRVTTSDDAGLLYGLFHVVRLGEGAFDDALAPSRHAPAHAVRMLDHWDNVDVHDVMGQVERGYAGGSIFYAEGALRADLTRVEAYARLLAASGVNRVAVNNVNVHRTEARLLTDRLGDVVRLADAFRPWGIRVHLAVSFAAPMTLGGLDTCDPLDPAVAAWWAEATARVYAAIPDFGGYVVKADSEGQPGPFAYGRDHADGANVLARALSPHGGRVHWRAFVYNHHQDWRDRKTDRARAAYDHFTPLDGKFDENVVVQVKFGPLDFQVREPVSPVLAAMPRTHLALELQVTQEYTGQQKHVYYLPEQWSEVLGWEPWGNGRTVAGRDGVARDVVAVSNVGDDRFWTGHPLAQANLYGFGRLAWDPTLSPSDLLDEWVGLTFPGADPRVRDILRDLMLGSRATYEQYTAPLGVCFMVGPGHYGPGVDFYEYSPWGTYHFADRDGIGVDRTRTAGTGYSGQYPEPWATTYESLDTCPDELLLFFHHVPYTHVLRSGKTVVQHVYDTHTDGAARTEVMARRWEDADRLVDAELFERVRELLAEQVRSAGEWRDQVRTYFWRHSGVPDERGGPLY